MHIFGLAMGAALCITSALSMSIAPHRPDPHLSARDPSPYDSQALTPRDGTWQYPVRPTTIRMVGTIGRPIGLVAFTGVMKAATAYIDYLIDHEHMGDDLIPAGVFTYTRDKGMIQLKNANNHQLTWQVVKTVVEALANVPELRGHYGTDFKIFDGSIQVGVGKLKDLAPS